MRSFNPPVAAQIERLRIALAARDRAGTNQAIRDLLEADAPLGGEWKRLAELMRVSGEFGLAHRAMDAFVAAAGRTPQARYAKVVLLTQTGRLREAHDLLESLPDEQMDRVARAYVLGNTALTLGRIEQGRSELEKVVRERPGWGPAWLSLSSAVDLANDPLGDRLLGDRAAAERQAPGDQARFHYALGKLHHDRAQHQQAFAAFSMGARLLRASLPYSRAGDEKGARAAMSGFPDAFIETFNSEQTIATDRPIIVTGLPRSGTTLVEQILTSHSAVADGAETSVAHHVALATGGVSGEAIAKHLTGGGSLEAMAGLYLHLLGERFGPSGRVVDKTIDNSRFLGLIATMLPQAPLIWMRRDPLDSAWSCFRTFFIHGVAWSYSLADIAYHFRLEDELLAFWQRRLGDRLLVVPYAALVDAPEEWTRRLLAHCGLAEEAAVHRFHETERVVATASALQVRRPINRGGIGVAEPYRAYLQPFLDAYR
ncbi:MAG TPA: sulfotransferase [Sphingomonas sp.]|nr:sulfotransferase [Sphingomonas sp.]